MFYRIIFLFGLFLSLSAQANIFSNVKSFQGDFEQTITNANGKEIVYKGKVFIKEPAKILWQYQEPIIKNVYIITHVAIIDEPELEQVIYTKLHNEVNLLNMIKKAKKIDEQTYIATVGEIEYKLLFNNKRLHKVTYSDALENSVVIDFTNTKQNIDIPNDTFQFFPPEYYDIVRQ